jgi:phenylalanyl-tRNA synthetase beta chain
MIQTQEKLAWNFGRKRKTISMGIYRTGIIKWPIIYRGVDPDSVSFVPLQWEGPLTLNEILLRHPKGREYGWIQAHEKLHPLLLDSNNRVLSYPPIINSADLGAVQVGDTEVFVELTGTDFDSIALSASIVACDLADQGYTIEPVEVCYESDTPYGRSVTTPFYFQAPVFCSLSRVERYLGEKLDSGECLAALNKAGCSASACMDAERGSGVKEDGVRLFPPPYRNDFLHAADVMEEIMIGRGLGTFLPVRPKEATIGRLAPATLFGRRVKEIMVGLGYQEMIYNYLGSREDLVTRMRGDGAKIVQITNPMTENYEFLRDSVLASLLASEAQSAHAPYPHKLFEVGKAAFKNASENYGVSTRQFLGALFADTGGKANFNSLSAELQTLFYYLGKKYRMEECADPRFIPGRVAALILTGGPSEQQVGVFGEIHPEVLENWSITAPASAFEIDLDLTAET